MTQRAAPTFGAFAAVLMMALAGCLGHHTTASLPAANPDGTETAFDTATIVGRVVDEEIVPVANASVAADGTGISAVTDIAGAFALPDLPVGNHTLVVQRDGYAELRQSVLVGAGETVTVDLRLTLLPSFAAHNLTHIFTGHFDCGHEIPIWTGDCMILYSAMTGQNDTQTSEDYLFRFPVEPRWDSFVMELSWEYAANNQLDGMRFYLEHVTNESTDHSVKVGRADGKQNPLAFVVHRGEPHPRADVNATTGKPATFPVEGARAQVRVFPKGHLYDQMCMASTTATGDCYLGVGAGVDIRFTVYATVFYNGRAPEGFSAIPAK
jgi:hypothetical protein